MEYTQTELMTVLNDHQKWLARTGGNRADLSNANLFGADLNNVNLSHANLSNADLSEANLFGADLFGADLSNANLFGANLSNVNLSHANLVDADLSEANLSNTNLFGANLSGADLSNVNLSRANLVDADLSEANLSGADLSEANLNNTNLSYTNLSNAKGILNPIEYIMENFEKTKEGIIVYKTFGEYYTPNPNWEIAEGSIIEEVVNPLPTVECGSGVNVATKEWVKRECNNLVWKCLIKWEWLAGVVVPYQTDGKIRASKVQLIKPVNLNCL